MNIKEILEKVAKGEALTPEEIEVVKGYDPQKDLDAVAAAARKKAMADADRAQTEAEALKQKLAKAHAALEDAQGKGKTETQKLQEQVAKLAKQIESANAEKAQLIRQQKLDDVIRTSGLQFVKEVDGGIMRSALINEFSSLSDDDLADTDKVKPIVDTFRVRNKAVILDAPGHGTGNPAHEPTGPTGIDGKPVKEMTPQEREADIKKRGML